MLKQFSMGDNNVLMNFSKKYCKSEIELLQSEGFNKVIKRYIKIIEKSRSPLIKVLKNVSKNELLDDINQLFKLLVIIESDEISKVHDRYSKYIFLREELIEFTEGLYDYWRNLERYAFIYSKNKTQGIQNANFIEESNNFTNLVLKTYRQIIENLYNDKFNIYRQLPSGINVGVVLNNMDWAMPVDYISFKNIPFIESIVLRPPFITYPKRNKRVGMFNEVKENPLKDLNITKRHWFCYPAKIENSLAYVYFHKDFMNQGVTLCNLLELAKSEEYVNKKPDIVYVFGAKNGNDQKETVYYHDKNNDIYVGFANYNDDIDYFGYMKKMLLTLHNLKMIDNNHLPIHGAMVNITMKNKKVLNAVIVGDSGAGKSESIEAFRVLSKDHLSNLDIIFDDMGTFKIKNNQIFAYGTETGAFIRLDDLENGYAYKEMDRAIFVNPDRNNARLVIPITSYNEVIKGYPVDILLYANNYTDSENQLSFFENKQDAIKVFKKAYRKAMGTTAEEGLVSTFFANPFGPLQKQEKTTLLLEQFFDVLYNNKIPCGELYTKLGIEGKSKVGPQEAAKKLFEWINKSK